MKTATLSSTLSRIVRTTAFQVLSVAALLAIAHVTFLLWTDLLDPKSAVRWLTTVLIAMVPAVLAIGVALILRNRKGRQAPPSGERKTIPAANPTSGSLEEALGSTHMTELRAQVELLCTMAGSNRIGPALMEELQRGGFSALAHQASVSAQVVSRILVDPRLLSELHGTSLATSNTALANLRNDLGAIAISLEWLSGRTSEGIVEHTPVWSEIELREKLTYAMDPVDRLLVQSTLLLSNVSDLASTLATSYGRVRGDAGAAIGLRERGAVRNAAAAIGSFNIPDRKLN